jgi:hypothetical protein
MKKLFTLSILLTILLNLGLTQAIPKDSLYFGLIPPGDSAIVFAPNIVCFKKRFEQSIAISPDGKEMMIGLTNKNWGDFVVAKYKYGADGWAAPFKNQGTDSMLFGIYPNYSLDNKRIYFTSAWPIFPPVNVWMMERTPNGWSEVMKVGEPISSSSIEFEVSISANSTLYFSSRRDGGFGELDVFYSKLEEGEYKKAINLGKPINTSMGDDMPFIAPDESYLIFGSTRGNKANKNSQLHISYRKEDGSWTNPKHMGPKINTKGYNTFPFVSPDGKYFFFSRREKWHNSAPSDIYWISSKIIDDLKLTNYAPYVKDTIPDQTIVVGKEFNYTIPASTFIDDDGNNTLTFTAELSNGSKLPDWLKFDPNRMIFSGTVKEKGIHVIRVIAIDTKKASTFDDFKLSIE